MTIRLPPDQMRRLEKVTRYRRQTKQSFVQEFVLAAISEIEDARRVSKPILGEEDAPKRSKISSESSEPGGGLGISNMLNRQPAVQAEESTPAAPPSSVVVQVGGAPTASNGNAPLNDLDRLALYVIKGDDFLRDVRKRTMLEVLHASARTDEEYNVLVAQLEQNIAVKTKVVAENSGVNKLTRIAFDKLSSLLMGD